MVVVSGCECLLAACTMKLNQCSILVIWQGRDSRCYAVGSQCIHNEQKRILSCQIGKKHVHVNKKKLRLVSYPDPDSYSCGYVEVVVWHFHVAESWPGYNTCLRSPSMPSTYLLARRRYGCRRLPLLPYG